MSRADVWESKNGEREHNCWQLWLEFCFKWNVRTEVQELIVLIVNALGVINNSCSKCLLRVGGFKWQEKDGEDSRKAFIFIVRLAIPTSIFSSQWSLDFEKTLSLFKCTGLNTYLTWISPNADLVNYCSNGVHILSASVKVPLEDATRWKCCT